MSTFLEPVIDFETTILSIDREFTPKLFNYNKRSKSKENISKHKIHRNLKNKLKKYKLRRDGQEDPEVLDVSQILVSSLKIKSPNSNIATNGIIDSEEELRPKNYLFKMGRKKQANKKKVEASDQNALVTNNIENKDPITSLMTADENISNTIDKHGTVDSINEKLHKNETENDSTRNTKDKKQTNAFTLMMDSRNKSIGNNSPGKEKVVEELDLQVTIEKKNIKAKRNLLLQKMAEAKGSLKKKEIEELQEKCIKKKMDKRAERLKSMIKANEPKPVAKEDIKSSKKEIAVVLTVDDRKDISPPSQKKEFKILNIFNDSAKTQNIPNSHREIVTKEDEFLKKLSPSLKKQENMLCYFKKVEKESDDMLGSQDLDDNTAVIKVKLNTKGKHRLKKKKLSLNKGSENIDENQSLIKEVKEINEPIKKKRDKNLESNEKVNFSKADNVAELTEFDIMRPRRNVKRPAKYIDDMLFSSSDEELHIFTPKKKKHGDQPNKCDIEIKMPIVETKSRKTVKLGELKEVKEPASKKPNTKANKEVIQPKKHTKLAPIFATKPQLDAAAIEAKQKFLNSGVPDKLKKIIDKQTSKIVGINHFHTVVHVQQGANMTPDIVSNLIINFHPNVLSDDESDEIVCSNDFFKRILKQETNREETYKKNLIMPINEAQVMLQNIKQLYPKFPVYRTYRLLKDKNKGEFKDCSYLDLDNSIEVINGMIDINNGSPDRLNWTDKYKAMSSKQIIGNFESIKEVKKWLISWTENDSKLKKNSNANSDSSDFYLSDTDSKDSMKSTNNLLVLTGPVGSGKTSLVYAVAAELAIKVLEVNASNKRTGKIMLQDLQEATQSHKVNRGKSSQELSQKSHEISNTEKPKIKAIKKRGRPKKAVEVMSKKSEPMSKNEGLSQPTNSQDSARTCMSLILIDDADIVFDQDDGFCAGIVQLVQCSKRPVILITSSTSCLHLQRFLQCAKVIHTRPLFPRMLGTWLDIMCLADSGVCWPGLGAKCLDYYKGDIRRSINFLQFQMAKDITDEVTSQNFDDYKASIEDENSNMSWAGHEEKNENTKINIIIDSDIWRYFMKEEASLLSHKYPLSVFRIWWNIPRLLIPPNDSNTNNENSKPSQLHLDVISNVADMISIADYFCKSTKDIESELISCPWMNFESDSVSEHECLDKYDRNWEVANEISHNLLSGSITKAQKDLEFASSTYLEFPEMVARREKDRVADRHTKLSNFLSPSAVLDRRGLALDYWSGCRTICRVERTRTDSNSKRNNRFCHYLKSANILCKSDSFDSLANSLYCKEDLVK